MKKLIIKIILYNLNCLKIILFNKKILKVISNNKMKFCYRMSKKIHKILKFNSMMIMKIVMRTMKRMTILIINQMMMNL
jgi:hypothetical protein